MPKIAKKPAPKKAVAKKKNSRATRAAQKTAPVVAKKPVAKSSSEKPAKRLPGYWRFSAEAFGILREQWRLFTGVTILSWLAVMLASESAQQSFFSDLAYSTQTITEGLGSDWFKTVVEGLALFVSLVGGALSSALSSLQLVIVWAVYLFTWLVVVWLHRHLFSGAYVRLRDGLYNAAAPVVPTVLLVIVGAVQLLPLLLGITLVNSFSKSGILSPLWTIIIGIILAIGLGILCVYWLANTIFALIIVTIPGTYPRAAWRAARKVATGYRLILLKRLVWLVLIVLLALLVFVLPFIYLDGAVGYQADWLVIAIYQLVSALLLVYGSTYLYLLYRRMIDA